MKKSDFQTTVKNMVLEFYQKPPIKENDAPVNTTSPPAPKRGDKSECCGAPMQWEGLTPYCTECGHETEPNMIGRNTDNPIREIYRQFKDVIKENINETDFSTKIRGVFYEYAQGVADVTPETPSPNRSTSGSTTSDITRDPEGAAKKGEAMKQAGDAVTQAAQTVKNINQTLKEYVDEQILPAVLEIIKQADNPRATKAELLEFFNLTPR